MAGFSRIGQRARLGRFRCWTTHRAGWVLSAFLALGIGLVIPSQIHAEAKKILAVLPFRLHSLQPMDHLKQQLQEMLTARMAKEGFSVVNPDIVNNHPMIRLPLTETRDIVALGRDLKADYVILGSLTHVGRKISLDLKVVDVAERRPPFSLFVVEDDLDRLADAADRASKSLYNQLAGVPQIDSILVRGNKRIESEAILGVLDSKKGDPLDPERLDKDLKSVFAMGFFKDVHINMEDGPQGKVVIINVTEKPSISRILFEGNKKEKEEDLKKETGIKLYSILNQSEIKQSVNRLKEYYRQKGYYKVEIQDKLKELPNNEVALTYEVQEGEKLYITKIAFQGNTKFTDRKLAGLMETSEKGILSWFTKSGLLDRKKLEYDLTKITSFYHNNGYIRAKTGEPKITVEEKGLTITIEVIEGPQYAVNEVRIEGDLLKPEEELMKKVNIKKEKHFNREVVRKDLIALRDVYADEGYANAEVAPLTKEDDKNHLVDIVYRISKKGKVRFERINITGNTETRDKVIRRELKVVEGEVFSGTNLKKSTQNLHRLGFFEDVEIQPRKGSQEDLMILDVNVKERPTGSFSIGAGYSSFDDALAMFTVAQNNLFGLGEKLEASGMFGGRTTEFDLKFIEPWFLEKPISMEIDLYNFKREYYEYTKDSYGGRLQFTFLLGLDDFTRGVVGYGYDDADITDVREGASLALREMIGRNLTSSVNLGIRRNSKDRPWNTTEGSYNSISYEIAGDPLGGDVAFNKYLATSAWYFPLAWTTVFMVQGRWGYVEARPEGKLPVYQKFRLGGINTIRGFDDYSITPRDPATGDPLGAEKFQIYNFEYRFPLLKEQGISGIVFFDVGNAYGEGESFGFSNIKKSVGPGIRWYSPIGPLRLEYGKVIGPKGDEASGNYHFSVGGLF
ncbi:MAG: outer membrane protein assembly factor BamA [Thermodesulfobacteriota bacterium]